MATIPTLFGDFLRDIRPTQSQIEHYKTGHETLRKRLQDDEDLDPFYVADFLQGSYRRSTALRPIGDEKSDVDIICVTNVDKDKTSPSEAMDLCVPFLENWYAGKWEEKGRSFGIELSYVEMDLVLTADPSAAAEAAARLSSVQDISDTGGDWLARFADEWDDLQHQMTGGAQGSDDWKTDPLDIPDREAGSWEKTDPLTVIEWTARKNERCNGHYVNVVKAIKWWRKAKDHEPPRPQSYPLEHIVGDCCPDGIQSVAEGITATLERIRDRYSKHYENGEVPVTPDRGIPTNNVLQRVTVSQFESFYEYVYEGADLARRALDEDDPKESAKLWQDLLGGRFPDYRGNDGGSDGGGSGGRQFTDRKGSTDVSKGRFA